MGRSKKGHKINGWINLDKPQGLTSTQALGKVRWLLNAQKAGHAGTLDPLATGVLPIALGEATKTIAYVQGAVKTYSFTVQWGSATNTDDSEGEAIATSDTRPTEAQIKALLPKFTGEIEQIPPQFSAIKINGERAYDLARDGETVEIKSRIVWIESLILLTCHPERAKRAKGSEAKESSRNLSAPSTTDYQSSAQDDDFVNSSDFTVTCGKGTYVRSIARDMGQTLGCYGHITALRRETVGTFSTKDAISLDFLEKMDDSSDRLEAVLPLQTVLDDIPALALQEKEAAALRNGQRLAFTSKPDFDRLEDAGLGTQETLEVLALFQGTPVALLEVKGPHAKPLRVFNM